MLSKEAVEELNSQAARERARVHENQEKENDDNQINLGWGMEESGEDEDEIEQDGELETRSWKIKYKGTDKFCYIIILATMIFVNFI